MNAPRKRRDYAAIMGLENGRKKEGGAVHPGCPIHKGIAMRALEELTEPHGLGWFEKARVLREVVLNGVETDLSDMADSINWDYIVRFINEQYDAELMPEAPTFFSGKIPVTMGVGADGKKVIKKMTREQALVAAEEGDATFARHITGKLLASGHGKKTAGYANTSQVNGLMVLYRLSRRKAVAQGVINAYERQRAVAVDKKVPGVPKTPPAFLTTAE